MLLSGEKVILRALEPTDLELLYAWENDTKVWAVSQTMAPFSKFVLRQYLETQHLDIYTTKQLRLVIQDKEGNAAGLIDLFEFDPQHLRVGVGILISEKHRGKGYAGESLKILVDYCFSHLGLHQVFANIGALNVVSKALFEDAGFIQAGEKVDWLKTPNGFQNELLYQLVKI
jgi:diamine N-acetyltransferase